MRAHRRRCSRGGWRHGILCNGGCALVPNRCPIQDTGRYDRPQAPGHTGIHLLKTHARKQAHWRPPTISNKRCHNGRCFEARPPYQGEFPFHATEKHVRFTRPAFRCDGATSEDEETACGYIMIASIYNVMTIRLFVTYGAASTAPYSCAAISTSCFSIVINLPPAAHPNPSSGRGF